MKEKEELAHDLTIVYLNNRFGVESEAYLSISVEEESSSSYSTVSSTKLPSASEIKYKSKPTGERYFFNLIAATEKIEDGFMVDEIFIRIIDEYYVAYNRFLELLSI